MSKVKNPQEKKKLSYAKDRRNSYGESDKGSRKSIPRSKRVNARSERAKQQKLKVLIGNNVDTDRAMAVESDYLSSVKLRHLQGFKKYPDTTLMEFIKRQKASAIRRFGRKKNS